MKICSYCTLKKKNSDFPQDRTRKGGRYHRCKPCKALLRKAERVITPEITKNRAKKAHRKALLKSRGYILAPHDVKSLQSYHSSFVPLVCEICRFPCTTFERLGLDHDHKTKNPRGFLCMQCNSALGMFSDRVDFLRNALEYLERTSDPEFQQTFLKKLKQRPY